MVQPSHGWTSHVSDPQHCLLLLRHPSRQTKPSCRYMTPCAAARLGLQPASVTPTYTVTRHPMMMIFLSVHCKTIRISTNILWRVFHILTEILGSRASLFRRYADTNVRGTGSVKIWKTRHKISVDIIQQIKPITNQFDQLLNLLLFHSFVDHLLYCVTYYVLCYLVLTK